jgi:hypothetical protein
MKLAIAHLNSTSPVMHLHRSTLLLIAIEFVQKPSSK